MRFSYLRDCIRVAFSVDMHMYIKLSRWCLRCFLDGIQVVSSSGRAILHPTNLFVMTFPARASGAQIDSSNFQRSRCYRPYRFVSKTVVLRRQEEAVGRFRKQRSTIILHFIQLISAHRCHELQEVCVSRNCSIKRNVSDDSSQKAIIESRNERSRVR